MPLLLEKPSEISKDHFLFKIDIGSGNSFPGQFANIRVGRNTDPLLRRPFSIHDHYDNTIELVIKETGKGTRYLINNTEPGDIDIIAPLGKGFSLCANKNILLIGGGVGNAPLYYLAKKLKENNNNINYLFAAKSAEYIYNRDKYSGISDNLLLSTDDGTCGLKGSADEIVKILLRHEKFERIFICGPLPMMKSIAEFILRTDIPFEVSLENYFGCGIGLCSGCAVETTGGIVRACMEGPVLNGRDIIWNLL